MEKVVLATLTYADAAGTPLTAMQVHRRLIASERVKDEGSLSLADTVMTLHELAARNAIHERNGWYSLNASMPDAFDRRMEEAVISADKWKKMLTKARWLQWVPFVQGIAASGSLAVGTTSHQSDWDMFVIARRKRLYTARIFLLLACRFMGVLRTKSDRVAPDKFCFNHYVTDDGLGIRHRSLFVAYAVQGLVPVMEREDVFSRFFRENTWISMYLAQGASRREFIRRAFVWSRVQTFLRTALELSLSGTVGDGIEAVLRWWQQGRIARDPATHAAGGRVVANERELEFHPRSAERTVLDRYNDLLSSKLGIAVHEVDSGLTA